MPKYLLNCVMFIPDCSRSSLNVIFYTSILLVFFFLLVWSLFYINDNGNNKTYKAYKFEHFTGKHEYFFFHLTSSFLYVKIHKTLFGRGFRPSAYVRSLIKINTQPTREIISIASLLSCCTNLMSFFIFVSALFIGITSSLDYIYIIRPLVAFVNSQNAQSFQKILV